MHRRVVAFALLVAVGAVIAGSATISSAAVTERGYVTTALKLPLTSAEARAYGRDFDRNDTIENALGQIFATFGSQGLDFQPRLDEAIASGDLLMLHSLRTPSPVNADDATWQVFYGVPTENPDFSGAGSFTIATPGPRSRRLPAKIVNRRVRTAPTGEIPLRLDLGGGSFQLDLIAGQIITRCSASGCSNGKINGAISDDDVDAVLIPAFADLFQAAIERDCPGPGPESCAQDSLGRSVQNTFDDNDDLNITAEELRANALMQSLLEPDVDLFGQDGQSDALSVGLGFEAVRAQLVRG